MDANILSVKLGPDSAMLAVISPAEDTTTLIDSVKLGPVSAMLPVIFTDRLAAAFRQHCLMIPLFFLSL